MFCKFLIRLDCAVFACENFFPMEDFSQKAAALAENIVRTYSQKGLTFCFAESCTGGLAASGIVGVPHASAVFKGSAVCYCDAAKTGFLGVEKGIVEKYFAESAECACAMAEACLVKFGADVAVSTTGFLDANTAPKPAGLAGKVFVAIASRRRAFPRADFIAGDFRGMGASRVYPCAVSRRDESHVAGVYGLSLDPFRGRNANRNAVVCFVYFLLKNILQ